MIRPTPFAPLAAAALLAAPAAWAQPAPNSTDTAMYFHSTVQDAADCAVTAGADGSFVFGAAISNPAATCPDAFAWVQFLQAVQAGFWENWANDETVWVEDPKPLCSADRANDCCFLAAPGETPQVGYRSQTGTVLPPAEVGAPGEFCPYIPSDWAQGAETVFKAGKTVSSHNHTFLRTLDPGRIGRQAEVEIVYRNDAFVRYTTHADIYSKAGLQALYKRMSGEAAHSKPYRPMGQGIAYPSDAVMFKADWIPQETMIELGYLTPDPANPGAVLPPDTPWITQKIEASTDDGQTWQEGTYYLLAITGASKALPNWHWYAFEHVSNLGRCDFTGCNDSYGYKTRTTVRDPNDASQTVTFDSNFVPPHVQDDELGDDSSLFRLGRAYAGGDISDGLAALFSGAGVGGGAAGSTDRPAITDPAWKNYRLKGTQTQFYTNDGYPTIVGASITEGGFVNTSSCMSCHVQASTNASGGPGTSVGGTGRLNNFGIGTSVNGAPYIGDFFQRGSTASRAVRTDFVWGVLLAN